MSFIEIRPPASLDEYQRACALVEEVYYEHGITSQRRVGHPKAIFVAVRDGAVLGSVGFRAGNQGTLPVEHYFGFEVAEVSSCPRDSVFEIVKLAAKKGSDRTVFRGLVAACAQYAFTERSFGLGFAILKPQLEKALNHFLHVPTHALPYAVVSERAAADYPRYFFEGLPPRPTSFHSKDRDAYLGRLLAELQGKAEMQCGDFDHRQDYSAASSYSKCSSAVLAA